MIDVNSAVSFHDGARRLVAATRPGLENVLVQQRIDSTHACALRLIEQAENEEIVLPSTMVIAAEQDNGQGRAGRTWISPLGGLLSELDRRQPRSLDHFTAADDRGSRRARGRE